MSKTLHILFKGLLLMFPFLLLFLIIESKLIRVPNNYTVKRDYFLKQAPQIETLILGSSHAFHGIAPKYLTQPSFNLAYASQDLYYDSRLLEKYINSLPKLKHIILEASYFSLEYSVMDIDEDWRSFFYYRAYDIPIEKNKYPFDMRNISYAMLYKKDATLRYLFSNGTNPEVTLHADGWDMLGSGGGCVTGESRATFHSSIMHSENVSLNLSHMQRMADVSKQKGVRLIITSPPVCPSYYDHIDKIKYKRFNEEIVTFSKKNKVEYLDYMNSHEFIEEDFIDSDHLGILGTIKYTNILNQAMKNE